MDDESKIKIILINVSKIIIDVIESIIMVEYNIEYFILNVNNTYIVIEIITIIYNIRGFNIYIYNKIENGGINNFIIS